MKTYISNFLILDNPSCPKENVVKYDIFNFGKVEGFIFGCFEDIRNAKQQGNIDNFSCYDLSVSSFLPFLNSEFLNFNGYYKQVCQLNESDINHFCRSNSGKKVWSGQVIKDMVDINFIKQQVQADELMFLAPLQECKNEVRFWIVNGNIVSYSPYNAYLKNDFSFYGDTLELYFSYVQHIIDMYEPDDKYVIDICESENKLKVVEYNCYSSSGFYNADISKIVYAIK